MDVDICNGACWGLARTSDTRRREDGGRTGTTATSSLSLALSIMPTFQGCMLLLRESLPKGNLEGEQISSDERLRKS